MNASTSTDYEELQEAIAEREVPPHKLASALADLLLRLIADSRFTSIRSGEFDRLADYIRIAAQLLNSGNEAARKQIREELWELADANRVKNSALYNVARCAIMVCGKFDEWNDAQDSPIFYCLQFLRKALPDVEPEFVRHFKQVLI